MLKIVFKKASYRMFEQILPLDSLCRIDDQHFSDYVLDMRVYFMGKYYWIFLDFLEKVDYV